MGKRFSLKYTRAIIAATHDGALNDAPVERDPRFGFDMVTQCPGVPGEAMVPRQTWADGAVYDAQAEQLAELFKANFEQFAEGTAESIQRAGPV